ncbi:hypothetical protein NIES2135_34060 [Leptolyngbya boryana NIES-2135]|uniref:Uncharacterized protein n=2 Tax=Leptolyngbya group TaxID=3081713 RepID=A0A1Z4JIH8_LEPBY|nr:hypothetical protein NIES2135_34060 [Leptolyngbya boryana NIES-2135]
MNMVKNRISQSLTNQQVEALLSDSNYNQNVELSERYGGEVYQLQDKRILAITNGVCRSRIYPSIDIFTTSLIDLESEWQGDEKKPAFLPLKKARKLLERNSGWSQNQDLEEQARIKFSEIYEHDDGQILTFPSAQILKQPFSKLKGALLYSSLECYQAQYEFRSKHMLAGLLPQQNKFIEAIPKLCTKLGTQLAIPEQYLDKSEASLKHVEWAIKRHGKRNCLNSEVFPSLLAYIGEVICHETHISWKMNLREGEIWEPWLVASDGCKYEFFVDLYKQLDSEALQIRTTVECLIDAIRSNSRFDNLDYPSDDYQFLDGDDDDLGIGLD